MKKDPFVLPLVLLWAGLAIGGGHFREEIAVLVACCCGFSAILIRRVSVKYAMGMCAIVLVSVARVPPKMANVGSALRTAVSGRMEGVVHGLQTTARGYRYVLHGELDLRDAPPVRCAVFVRELRGAHGMVQIQEGARRIVFGQFRPPYMPTLPRQFDEQAMCSALEADFVAETVRQGVFAGDRRWDEALRLDMRRVVQSVLQKHLPNDVEPIVRALLLGDRTGIDRETLRLYAASGTIHMFCVSGSHVAIVLGLLLLVMGPRLTWMRVAILVVAIGGYVWLCGADPPAVRAACMGGFALIGRYRERGVRPINLLCASAFFLLLIDPTLYAKDSFQLSVSAVASILIIAPWWIESFQRLFRPKNVAVQWFVHSLGTSIAASIGTALPIVLGFGSYSISSPIANLVVVPLLSVSLLTSVLLLVANVLNVAGPVAWCVSSFVRLADVAATKMAWGLDGSGSLIWLLCTMALICCVLTWPIAAESVKQVLLRLVITITAATVLLVAGPYQTPLGVVTARKHGVLLAASQADTLNVLFAGNRDAPMDYEAVRWVGNWDGPVVVFGLGSWGRRMKGSVRTKSVILPSDLRTQKVIRP